MKIRFGNSDIIAENLIKSDAQRFYARSFSLAFFQILQKTFTVAQSFTKFVQFFRKTLFDDSDLIRLF